MARAKEYTYREFQLLLKKNGYELQRSSGDHCIFSNGKNVISVPNQGKKLNKMICRRLIKENNLSEG